MNLKGCVSLSASKRLLSTMKTISRLGMIDVKTFHVKFVIPAGKNRERKSILRGNQSILRGYFAGVITNCRAI